jgi:hypothetical protein
MTDPAYTMARGRKMAGVKAERIDRIVELMSNGQWNNVVAGKLAEEWVCSLQTVKQAAAEASRIVRGAFRADREQIRTWALTRLHTVAEEAEKERKWIPVIAAIREIKEITGIAMPIQVELAHKVSQMSTDELLRLQGEFQRRATAIIEERKMLQLLPENAESLARAEDAPDEPPDEDLYVPEVDVEPAAAGAEDGADDDSPSDELSQQD